MITPLRLDVIDTEHNRTLGAYTFVEERVTIGRGDDCNLVLPDTTRVVSKQHAEIWLQDGTFYVHDLESKNHTFLNDQRLPAKLPCALSDGDTLRVGLYVISVWLDQAAGAAVPSRSRPAPSVQSDPVRQPTPVGRPAPRTPHAPAPPSPDRAPDQPNLLATAAADLAGALRALRLGAADATGQAREQLVRDALRRALPTLPMSEYEALVSVALERPAPTTNLPPASPPPARLPDAERDAIERLLDMVLPALGKLAGLPLRFKHEFIGQTIVHSREMEVLFGGDPKRIRTYLFDPSATSETRRERLIRMQRTLDEVLRHEVAMIDGYRAAAQSGMTRLLDHVDPAMLTDEIGGGLAFFNKGKLLDEVTQRCAGLRAEDWSTVERRIFRPAFIKAYDARMRQPPMP